jgi:hypothetical protein
MKQETHQHARVMLMRIAIGHQITSTCDTSVKCECACECECECHFIVIANYTIHDIDSEIGSTNSSRDYIVSCVVWWWLLLRRCLTTSTANTISTTATIRPLTANMAISRAVCCSTCTTLCMSACIRAALSLSHRDDSHLYNKEWH